MLYIFIGVQLHTCTCVQASAVGAPNETRGFTFVCMTSNSIRHKRRRTSGTAEPPTNAAKVFSRCHHKSAGKAAPRDANAADLWQILSTASDAALMIYGYLINDSHLAKRRSTADVSLSNIVKWSDTRLN
jgi:hypothetical protein